MASPDKQPGLPDIQETDIASLLADEAAELNDKKELDPFAKWLAILPKYPILCKEIDNQAHTEVLLSSLAAENGELLAQRFNRFGAHIIAIYEYAAMREACEQAEERLRIAKLHFSDGDDGVSQPL